MLVPARSLPLDRHPAFVYLARLAPGSRRTMVQALRVIAELFGQTLETMQWAALRYQHTAQGRDAAIARALSALVEVSE